MAAPLIPSLNDPELERILEQAAANGAREAGYILLRLPLELKDLWREWLDQHYPDRASRIMRHIREARGGQEYDAQFGRLAVRCVEPQRVRPHARHRRRKLVGTWCLLRPQEG